MTTVVVAGALAHKPGNGGEAWVRMSWLRGMSALGLRTVFVEQIGSAACVDAAGVTIEPQRSVNAAWFEKVTVRFGIRDCAALLDERGNRVAGGMTVAQVDAALSRAVALINISGNLTEERLLGATAKAVYVDIDPGFTQYWHAAGLLGDLLQRHRHHVTIGANIGSRACPVPTGEIEWSHVNQPVVLQDWPMQTSVVAPRFTTVASWRGAYGPIVDAGRTYGLKVHEFRKFLTLPERVPATCEVALSINAADDKDRQRLEAHGWVLCDPYLVAGDTDAFRVYVQGSAAELSPAQGIYVETGCGWFSDRSVRYLASGRPVVVQDTGLAGHLPLGEGLLTFTDVGEAAECVAAVIGDYARHCRAAREVAEAHFDSAVVFPALLEELGVGG